MIKKPLMFNYCKTTSTCLESRTLESWTSSVFCMNMQACYLLCFQQPLQKELMFVLLIALVIHL